MITALITAAWLGASLRVAPPVTFTVPLEVLRTRHIAVQAKINGQGPFRLVLDTGAPITFINRRLAAKLGLMSAEAAKKKMVVGMGGQVKVHSLEVGEVKAENVPVMLLDHPIVEMIGQVEGGIDGIIGYTFWGRYKMTLDYEAKQAVFDSTPYEIEDVLSSVMGKLLKTDDRPPLVSPAGIWGMKTETRKNMAYPVVLTSTTSGWPADAGGLRIGDRLLTINGRWIDSNSSLLDALSIAKPGTQAEIVVKRGTQQQTLWITPRPGL
jgi:hypothetical protein